MPSEPEYLQLRDLHKAMKALLPNAVFIGFTGTPLLKADKAKSIESEFSQGRFKLLNEKRADMVKVLAKELPGWGEELGTKITQHAISKGWTAEELQTLTNPRVVMALEAERKYELAQKGKAELKAKVKDVPQVVKPGAKRPVAPQSKTAMDRFKHTKSDEDAIAALESRVKR